MSDLDRCKLLFQSIVSLKDVLAGSFEAVLKDTGPLNAALAVGRSLDACGLSAPIADELRRTPSPEKRRQELAAVAGKLEGLLEAQRSTWSVFEAVAAIDTRVFLGGDLEEMGFDVVIARLARAIEGEFSLGDWMHYRKARLAAGNSRGALVATAFDGMEGPEPGLAAIFELCLVRTLIRQQLGTDARDLAELGGASLEDARTRFSALDKEITKLEARRIAANVQERPIAHGNDRGPKSQWSDGALIRNEVSKKKRHLPIRMLVKRAHNALGAMKPVWLMSPLTVAQYLPQTAGFFDLVIIDEASQMRPADAIGAVARAHQAIIVGDPLQLPPTDFFNAPSGDSEQAAEGAADGHSSILDLAEARLRRKRMLRWHYRSRHQSLIALSNKEFYENRLVVFPSAESSEAGLGVEHTYVGGKYVGEGINPEEAKAVIERARRSIEQFPDRSLGIATTNLKQRELIIEELERLTATDKSVAPSGNLAGHA